MTRSGVITIHLGELLQIKRMIVQDGQERGNLHGLLTESDKPVILIVFGGNEEKRNSCEDYLSNRHALKKHGDWCVESNYTEGEGCFKNDNQTAGRRGVLLLFDDKGKSSRCFYNENEAELEIIEGQSAFRLSESVRKMLPKTSERPNANLPIDLWYDTDRGRAIMVEMHKRFPESEFSIRGITRDSSSYDMTMEIQYNNGVVPVSFPNDFPIVKPTVENGVELTMSDIDESVQTGKVVQSFVDSLSKFLDRNGLSKKEKTIATAHEIRECQPEADETKDSLMQGNDTNVKNAAPNDDAEDRNGVGDKGNYEMPNSGQDTSPPDTGTSVDTLDTEKAKTTDLTKVKQPDTAHLYNETSTQKQKVP